MAEDVEALLRGESELRELRRRMADWRRIEELPPRLRAAVKYYVEVGDLYVASRIAGLRVHEMRQLLLRVGVPIAP